MQKLSHASRALIRDCNVQVMTSSSLGVKKETPGRPLRHSLPVTQSNTAQCFAIKITIQSKCNIAFQRAIQMATFISLCLSHLFPIPLLFPLLHPYRLFSILVVSGPWTSFSGVFYFFSHTCCVVCFVQVCVLYCLYVSLRTLSLIAMFHLQFI